VTSTVFRNILIIKPGAIGDLLQITPVIRALKTRYPDARISLLVSARSTASLFHDNPHVHETIVFDKRGEHRSLPALCKLWKRLRHGRYDLVLNFQRSNLKAWFLVSAAFPCRVLVYHKARGRIIHAVANHLETLTPLGIGDTADLALEFEPGADAARYAEQLFSAHGLDGEKVVALNPGASNRIKCWSPRRFAELGDRLIDELGVRVVLVGGGDERDLAEAIRAGMRNVPLDLIGATSLPQLGAVLAKCAILVSGDTGPLHMATAVKTPVIALFGAIDPRRTGPIGNGHVVVRHAELPCVPCNAKSCTNQEHLACMERITVDEVFQEVVAMLGKGGERP
jgi:lipopolysaccharide heptosyltransferase II